MFSAVAGSTHQTPIQKQFSAASLHLRPARQSALVTRANAVPTGAVTAAALRLPSVDWRRYHLQVLFVDHTDTVRARIAAGLFESIAEWNGYGRAMYPWTAGVHARDGERASLSTQASLMQQALALGMAPRAFSRPAEKFVAEDLDRFDVVVAVDSDVFQSVQEDMERYALPADKEYYSNKLALLTDFSSYPGDAILKTGGTALLPRKISRLLVPELAELLKVKHIQSPDLTTEAGRQEWNSMVYVCMLACAGLVKYLIDAYPDDLPEYDPL